MFTRTWCETQLGPTVSGGFQTNRQLKHLWETVMLLNVFLCLKKHILLTVSLSLTVCLSVCPSIYISACQTVYISVYTLCGVYRLSNLYLSDSLYFCLFICLSNWRKHLSLSLSIYIYIYIITHSLSHTCTHKHIHIGGITTYISQTYRLFPLVCYIYINIHIFTQTHTHTHTRLLSANRAFIAYHASWPRSCLRLTK